MNQPARPQANHNREGSSSPVEIRLSRILRGEILFKTMLSRSWRYERYWPSIYGNCVRPRACRRRSWRTARRSIAPISAPLSEASMLLVLTSSTGWQRFSVLRRQIFFGDRPRMGIKREAGASLALNRVSLSKSASGLREPGRGHGEPRAQNAPAADPEHRIGGNHQLADSGNASLATGFATAARPRLRRNRKRDNKTPRSTSGALLHSAWISRRWACGCGTRSGCRSRRLRRRRGWRRSER